MGKSTAGRVLAATVLVPVLAGCGGGITEPDGIEPTGTAPPIDEPLPEASVPPDESEDSPGPLDPPPAHDADPAGAQTETAIEDLVDRLDVPADEVTVVRAEFVTWPDGAVGCPEPGMAYTQALVEGMLIELKVDGESYRYHSSTDREPFLCTDPRDPVGSEG